MQCACSISRSNSPKYPDDLNALSGEFTPTFFGDPQSPVALFSKSFELPMMLGSS